MNAGIFLVATQGNIHALSISPKGLIMGMLLAITTCFYGVLPGPLLKKYPAESVCAWAMLIGGGVLAVFLRPWRIPDNRNRGNNLTVLSVSGSSKIRRKCICRIIIKRGAGSGNDRGGDLFRNCIPGNRYSGICTGIIYTFHFEYQFEINTGNKYR